MIVLVVMAISLSGCTLFGRGNINDFADELFPSLFANDALSANFFFENPSAAGINPTANLSTPQTKADYESNCAMMEKQALMMAAMFRYSKMNPSDKELFTFLQDFFVAQSKYGSYYYLQDSFIGSYMGMQANLPIYLTEYKFRSKQDIENYLSLCNQSTTAFPTYVDYEKQRIDNGYGRATYVLEGAIEQTEAFSGIKLPETDFGAVNPSVIPEKENFVLTNFKTKITDLSVKKFLTDDEITTYIETATSAINTRLIPAYIKLGIDIKTLLTSYDSSYFNNNGLANYKNGKEYYQVLFNDATGTNDTIDVATKKLLVALNDEIKFNQSLQANIQSDLDILNANIADTTQHKTVDGEIKRLFSSEDWNNESVLYDTINTLKGQLSQNFPAMPTTEGKIELKQIDQSLAENYYPAAFFVSALDNLNANEVIVINSSKGSTGYLSYDLLSHEGIPGHLYQYTYMKHSDKHNIVKVLSPTSYKEAWATYAQYYMADSYKPNTLDNKLFKLQLSNTLYNGYLRTLVDIWVNYDGITVTQLATKLATILGGTADDHMDNAKNAFESSVEVPTNAATYYYSYLTLMEIKSKLTDKGYNDLQFHTAILNNPYTFTMIKENLGI